MVRGYNSHTDRSAGIGIAKRPVSGQSSLLLYRSHHGRSPLTFNKYMPAEPLEILHHGTSANDSAFVAPRVVGSIPLDHRSSF